MTDQNSRPNLPADPATPIDPSVSAGAVPEMRHTAGQTSSPSVGDTTATRGRRTDDALSSDDSLYDDVVVGSSSGGSSSPPAGGQGEPGGGQAREKASHVAGTAKEKAGAVMDAEKTMARDTAAEATDRAKATLAEAKVQVKDLWQQSRSEISDSAGVQLQRLSEGARSLSDELGDMASASDDPGIASDLARRASGYFSNASTWLENRGPEEVLTEVKQFARRSPGAFLALAGGLGLIVGRVSRSLKDDSSSDTSSTGQPHDRSSAPHGALAQDGTSTWDDASTIDQHLGEGQGAGRTPSMGTMPTPVPPIHDRAPDGGDLR